MTTYFGPRWNLPLLDDGDIGGPVRVATPVGEPCYVCDEPVAVGDRGLLRTSYASGRPVHLAVHLECDLLDAHGHRYGHCTCTGKVAGRRAALEMLEVVNLDRAVAGFGAL